MEDIFDRAVRHHNAEEYAEAERLYRRILQADPAHGGALFNLAILAQEHGQPRAARELWCRFLDHFPNAAQAHFRLGTAQRELFEYEESLASFLAVKALQPDFPGLAEQLAGIEEDLRLDQDPDYARQRGAPWSAEDQCWLEENDGSTLLVLFAGLGVGRHPPTFVFYNFLRRYTDIDKLFIRDLSQKWYFGGLPPLSGDVASTADYLRTRIAGYDRSVFLGCSAGGMAAILLGELAGATRVLAFSPQTVLSDAKEREFRDYRWQVRIDEIRRECREPHFLDLAAIGPLQASVDIHYADGDRLDRLHALRVRGERVRHVAHRGCDHVLALALRDRGDLQTIIEREL